MKSNIVVVNELDDEFRIAVSKLTNLVLYVEKKDGTHFLSKLVAVRGDTLVFCTKSGMIRLNNLSEIAYAVPFTPSQKMKRRWFEWRKRPPKRNRL